MTNPVRLTTCPICDGTMKEVRGPRDIRIGNRQVTVEDTYQKCDNCGEEFYAPGQLTQIQKSAAERIRADEGLLSPDAIRAIRANLELSQAEFEQLLGVGPKTVVRWEKGTVFQNRATDTLLRVLEAVPEAVAYLTQLRGFSTTEAVSPSQVVYQPLDTTKKGVISILPYLPAGQVAQRIQKPLSTLVKVATR